MLPSADITTRRQRPQHGGFTLLEIMLSMLIVTTLVASIFAIVSATVQLSDEIVAEGNKDARNHGLQHLLQHLFLHLPAQAQLRLATLQKNTDQFSQLTLAGALAPFGSGTSQPGDLLFLEAGRQSPEHLHFILRWAKPGRPPAAASNRSETGRRLVLAENLTALRWRVFNPVSGEWEPLWNETLPLEAQPRGLPLPSAPRPTLIELSLTSQTGESQRHVFWIPPVRLP